MHDSHLSGRADRPPGGQPSRRATRTFRRTPVVRRPPKTQNAKDIVADSLHAQGAAAKLTTGFRAAIAAVTLAACSPAGDFGRPQIDPAPLGSTISTDSLPPAGWHTDSRPLLTEDERELRNRAWLYLDRKPPVWQDAKPEFEVSDYYIRLVKRRPPDAAWARLNDDIRVDIRLAEAFFDVARRVQKMDRLRATALTRPTQANLDASGALTARLAENAGLVGSVEKAFRNRIAGYEYAAERLATEAPSPATTEVRKAIRSLERGLSGRPAPRTPEPLVIRAE